MLRLCSDRFSPKAAHDLFEVAERPAMHTRSQRQRRGDHALGTQGVERALADLQQGGEVRSGQQRLRRDGHCVWQG